MGITSWAMKLQKRLSGRKPMPPVNRKKQRKKGPAGEQVDYRVAKESPIGKAQSRSRRTKQMLDELD